MAKDRIRVEKVDFEETDDELIDSDNVNANRDESANSPRRQPSKSNGRRGMSPNRDIVEPTNMRRRQAIMILRCNSDENQRDTRRKCRMLARKYHPSKWRVECVFSKEDSMHVFKGIANACEFLVLQNLKFDVAAKCGIL